MNITADGHVSMDKFSQFQYVCRSLYLVNRYFFRQLPKDYHVAIHKSKFFESMTMFHNGEQVSAGPWELGPDDFSCPSGVVAASSVSSFIIPSDDYDDIPANTAEHPDDLATTPWNATSSSDAHPAFIFLARPPSSSRQEAFYNYCRMSRAVGITIPLTSHHHRNAVSDVPPPDSISGICNLLVGFLCTNGLILQNPALVMGIRNLQVIISFFILCLQLLNSLCI